MDQNSNKKKGNKKKRKINLVFNPEARREFLTGFHKRKLERKMKAQQHLQKMVKEERKRIKQEAKQSYKNLVVSHRSVPEVEHLLSEEHDMGTHSVEIVELSTHDLAVQNNWIGANQMKYEVKEEEEEESEEEDEASTREIVPGMDLKEKPKVKAEDSNTVVFKTAKDVKKVIKKEASKQVKKSKAFQLKNKLEKIKNRKKSQHQNVRKKKMCGKKGRQKMKAKAARRS